MEEVRELANTLATNDPTGYRLYLLNQAAAHTSTYGETVSADDAATLTWANYMSTTFHYIESNGAPVINYTDDTSTNIADDASTNTHNLLSKYGIRTYENGICYYTYWIKHANDGDESVKGKMEHAIVRNNIYKIEVNGVRDLGDDIPSEEDNKLSIVVAVKDWTVLSQENFEF
ncbi:MAG: fimbria major subunit [Bacteroidales bacterium]|nr:fimbria major subunit [Bacteroidales bacterium]